MNKSICGLLYFLMIVPALADEAPSDYVLTLDGYTLEGAAKATHAPGSISEGGSRAKPWDRQGWVNALHWSEFCFIGRVDTLVADCILDPEHTVQYIALVRFEVIEPYWGIYADHHVAEVHLQNSGECIRYSAPYPYPPGTGDTFLAYGYVTKEGRTRIVDTQLLKLVDDVWVDTVGDPLQTPELFDFIATVKAKRDIPTALREADCVATAQALYTAETDSGKMTMLRVENVHTGLDLPDVIRIIHEHGTRTDDVGDWTYPPRFTDGAQHLLALKARYDGDFVCINGFLGAWRIDGDDLLSLRSQPVGSYAEIVTLARSLNKPHRLRNNRPADRSR